MLLCISVLLEQSCSPLLGILYFSLWEVPVTEAELNDRDSHFYNTEKKGVRVMGSFFQRPNTSKQNPSQDSLLELQCSPLILETS